MQLAACKVADQIQGFKLAFVQSDEVSFLLTDYDELNTQGWFDYNLLKIISIAAATMSTYFSQNFCRIGIFDGRAFNIPPNDVANYFVWRAKDWARNSLSMYARSLFSHKQLINKHSTQVHEMLYDINRNWATDLSDQQKNGTWILANGSFVHTAMPTYDVINAFWQPQLEEDSDK
jgi:tRNA(His) 5'-end guanylyltransferase